MNRKIKLSPSKQRTLLLSGLLMLSGLIWGCSKDSPVVDEIKYKVEEETYSASVREGSSDMPPDYNRSVCRFYSRK